MAYILIDVRGLGSHSGTSNARSAQEATASLEPPTRTDTTANSSHSGSSHSGSSHSSSHTSFDPLLYTTTTGQSVSDPTAANSHAGTRPEATSIHSGSSTGTTRTTTTTTDDDQTLIDYTNAAFEAALQEQQAAQQAEQRYTSIQQQPTAAMTDPGTNNGGKKWPWIVAAIGAAGLLGYAIFGKKKNKKDSR